ncbi:MAG: hypothetical protein JO002_12635 [Burkholderiaceae bacterium]|nr:hypothetical protein [Burkholderiaceae bacterium]
MTIIVQLLNRKPDAKYPRTEKNVQVAKFGNIPAATLVTKFLSIPCLPLPIICAERIAAMHAQAR